MYWPTGCVKSHGCTAHLSLMRLAASRVGAHAGHTKILFASETAQMIFVALCTVVVALYITRMIKTSGGRLT